MAKRQKSDSALLEDDPLWYQDAIIYQTHVKAYHDANGDGIGDFQGLTQKLDYIQDLGVTAVWILPFYPSPLRDDGYDIADYNNVHADYGTLKDFRDFLREAHARGLRVITELVMNHTSDRHPWFQRARRARPGSRARDYYVWNDTTDRYKDVRIIFKDFETSNWAWDPVAKAYYWHRFFSHQPDLNFDNPEVHKAMFRALDFWFKMGVDGVRLDAIPYLYEREGTSSENLPETHEFLKKLRRHVDSKYKNRMLLAEANQWPEDAVEYFGDGDETHMAFHFPLMPRLYMAHRMEDRTPIIDILEQTPEIPSTCQWANFLRNHDELTLEMVTDEERDYMYRMYAQEPRMRINLGIRRRLAPLLGNNRRSIELMNSLLFSLTGTPILYYGDEIGMGDNIYLGDRDAVRTPMQWSPDRNAGFSQANAQRLYLPVIIDPEHHYQTVNVESQQANAHSLLWWMKRMIAMRRRYRAFGRGSLEFLHPENHKVLVFLRRYEEEVILVVANLSRFSQCVELDLSHFKDQRPVEMFGHTVFPPIGDLPYFLTLGPHAFYWFHIEPARSEEVHLDTEPDTPKRLKREIVAGGPWTRILRGRSKEKLEAVLPDFLMQCRWFGGKARRVKSAEIVRVVGFNSNHEEAGRILTVNVEYVDGEPDTYALPVMFAPEEETEELLQRLPAQALITRLRASGSSGLLYDAVYNTAFCEALLQHMIKRRSVKADGSDFTGSSLRSLRRAARRSEPLTPSLMKVEQSNSSVVYGDRFMLKLFRRLDEGVNPDLEIMRYLTEHTSFRNVPELAGYLELKPRRGDPLTLGLLQTYVQNEGDAWRFTRDVLKHFCQEVATHPESLQPELPTQDLLDLSGLEPEGELSEAIGFFLHNAVLLGRRTGEMHVALGAEDEDPAFTSEGYNPFNTRAFFQSVRNHITSVMKLLRKRVKSLPTDIQPLAREVLDVEPAIRKRAEAMLKLKLRSSRIRTHGDYHLGQILYTGTDFIIIDFEGEPARSIGERRIKRSPLRDVAGMLRSFQYAARSIRLEQVASGAMREEEMARIDPWLRAWEQWVCAAFLKGYREAAAEGEFLPRSDEEFRLLLETFMLEKAIYELDYELNNRPDWAGIPLSGILQMIGRA